MDVETSTLQSGQVKPNNLNPKIIWAGVLLLVVFVGAFLIYKWPFTKDGILPSTNSPQNLILNIKN